ncbi:MAG: HAD family phosphatase [Nitrospirae bacterium]|nr:HAD family phosphatase [Nitrospirota bacterium]
MAAPAIRLLLWDLGKVLVAFDHRLIAERLAPDAFGPYRDPERLFTAIFHPATGLVHAYDEGQVTSREFHALLRATCGLRAPYAAFARKWSAIFAPIPETIALLERLKGRCEQVLLSNTNALHFAYIAQHAPFIFLFDARILSFRVGLRKPDPAIFRLALDCADVAAEETLLIDDRPENVAAAEALGIHGHHFTDAEQLARALLHCGLLERPFSR